MPVRRQKRYSCPVEVTLSVINGKWKPRILFLLKSGARRFSVLQTALPGVSHKVLTQQLRQLEDASLIRRVRNDVNKVVSYGLTEFGRNLRPSLAALAAWGEEHHRELGCELVMPVVAKR